jgi:hypothetical protein
MQQRLEASRSASGAFFKAPALTASFPQAGRRHRQLHHTASGLPEFEPCGKAPSPLSLGARKSNAAGAIHAGGKQ